MRTLILTASLALVACSGGDKPSDESGTPTGSAGGTTTGTLTGVTTSDPDRTAALDGVVQHCDGTPMEGAQIRFCDPSVCRNQTTEADGAFDYTNTLIGWNSFEAFGPDGTDLATGFVPLLFGDGESRSLTMTLCPHDPWTALSGTPTEIETGSGLYLTLSTALLEKPTPFDDDATEAAGLLVDPANHVPVDELTGTVAAQWFLEPFNYKAADTGGIAYRVDGATLGLSAASYHVYVGSYDDFAWLDAGTISDGDADGWYTPDGDGLPLMGTVMLLEQ